MKVYIKSNAYPGANNFKSLRQGEVFSFIFSELWRLKLSSRLKNILRQNLSQHNIFVFNGLSGFGLKS